MSIAHGMISRLMCRLSSLSRTQEQEFPPIMASQFFEIVVLGDFRDPHFQTIAASRINAVVAAGYRAGLLQLATDHGSLPARLHPDIRQLIDDERLSMLDPDQPYKAKLVVVSDPLCLTYKPKRRLHIDTPLSIVLVSHGPTAATGQELYNWKRIYQNANDVLAGELIWAPASPIVREQLAYLNPKPRLSNVDWHICVDAEPWHSERTGFQASRPVIGRSGPPSEEAWPVDANHIISLYPDDPQILVRILDGGSILKDHVTNFPRNWDLLSSTEVSEHEFLNSIDFYVYGHHPQANSPVDPYLLRAMASGALAILPPSYEPIFGDGAVYSEAEDVSSTIWRLFNDHARFLSASQGGVRRISDDFSFRHLRTRIANLIGAPRYPSDTQSEGHVSKITPPALDRRRIMFVTINGVGMGHLTRMLAIAKRCQASIEPVFVTMSQALKVLREQGYLAEFIPSRQYLDCDINHWNRYLHDELNEMIAFYDPAVIVFDGNVPYQGLIDSIKSNPDPWFIWSRRGMWRADNESIISREDYFQLVLEPGDLAGSDDHGITTRYQDRTYHVRSIRLLDPIEMLSREDARRELGMSQEKTAILIQLGAGNNFDYRSIYKTALSHIQERHDAEIAVGEWLISDQPIDLPETVKRMPGYPFARYFNAFDIAISAVGYNSFHELLFAGIPTIFVPNEAMKQDSQIARALYADRHGLALCVRTNEIYRLTSTIDKLFDKQERESIKARLARLDPTNGAAEAAALINEMAYSRRADRP